jgi:MFS-type transporter involved in bile tolerance (Atg22 family)
MTSRISKRFWVELLMGIATALVAILTAIVPSWMERLFGVNLDHGDGSFERLIVYALLLASLACLSLARLEWRRLSSH